MFVYFRFCSPITGMNAFKACWNTKWFIFCEFDIIFDFKCFSPDVFWGFFGAEFNLSHFQHVRWWSHDNRFIASYVSEMCISRIKFGQLYIVAYLKIFFISLSLIITGPMALTTMIGIQQEMLYRELWLGNYRLLWSLGTFKMFQKTSKSILPEKRYPTYRLPSRKHIWGWNSAFEMFAWKKSSYTVFFKKSW